MKNADSNAVFPFFSLSDLDMEKLSFHESTETFPLHMPDEYQFLHEAAAIEFHGTVFAAWYNNREKELQGETVIRGRRGVRTRSSTGFDQPVQTAAGLGDALQLHRQHERRPEAYRLD